MATLEGDHWAYFGDGNAAQIVEVKDVIDMETGIKRTRFIFLPSKRIEKMYDIAEEQDPSTGFIIREYDSVNCLFLERGVSRTRCWVMTDFDEGPTIATRRSADLTEALYASERLLRIAEAGRDRAYQELSIAREQIQQQLKQQVNMVKEVRKAAGRTDGEGDYIGQDYQEGE